MEPNEKSSPIIFPDLTVSEVLERWPQTIPVFLKYQTSCVGCSMAPFDTLQDAMDNYCLPLDEFLGELENAASQIPS